MTQVLTANDFASGAVVYWSKEGWQKNLADADGLNDQGKADEVLSLAEATPQEVVGAYLITVEGQFGQWRPSHIREVIRAQGPSHQETYNKGGSVHVSL